MTNAQRIERARRAKQYSDEFLEPALALIEADYSEKIVAVSASTDPRQPEIVTRLGIGIQVVRQVRALIATHIADGKVAQSAADRVANDKELTEPQRRLLNIGVR